jgi:hypothetical protein
MNFPNERKRSLLVQCWDIVHAEPIGPRQERLRYEVSFWAKALRDAQEFGADDSEKQALRHLRAFLERNS